ncbi:MAG: endonuclease III [Nitrospiria bacterium]
MSAVPAAQRRRVVRILDELDQVFHGRRVALEAADPWQLLAATILSAQCTDARVNQVTPALFAAYPTADALAAADHEAVERLIKSTGFYRAKTRHLIACGRAIVERFGGAVPRTMEDLVTLPGVGRKTANVILGNAFDRPAVVVDTHVKRVAKRLGLTSSADPVRIESDLQRLIPEASWTAGSHHLLLHGRHVCVARRPRCERCSLSDGCDAPEKRAALPSVAVRPARRVRAPRAAKTETGA